MRIFILSMVVCLGAQSAFGERPFRGYYEVPLSQDSENGVQNPANRFQWIKFKSNTADVENAKSLELQLPPELLGEPFSFVIARNTATSPWSGDALNEAKCDIAERELPVSPGSRRYMTCFLHFKSPPVDLVKVEAKLRAQPNLSQEEIRDRLNVARTFRDEHFGFLHYEMRGRGGGDSREGSRRGRRGNN